MKYVSKFLAAFFVMSSALTTSAINSSVILEDLEAVAEILPGVATVIGAMIGIILSLVILKMIAKILTAISDSVGNAMGKF